MWSLCLSYSKPWMFASELIALLDAMVGWFSDVCVLSVFVSDMVFAVGCTGRMVLWVYIVLFMCLPFVQGFHFLTLQGNATTHNAKGSNQKKHLENQWQKMKTHTHCKINHAAKTSTKRRCVENPITPTANWCVQDTQQETPCRKQMQIRFAAAFFLCICYA